MAYPVMPLGFLGSQGDNDKYRVERSLRFNSADSAYLSRTPASITNQKTYTFNFWVKRSVLGTTQQMFSALFASTSLRYAYIGFSSSDTLEVFTGIYSLGASTTASYSYITTQVFRDTSAWYMITVAVDTTNATASDRVKIYVNGTQVTSFSTATQPALNQNGYWNSTQFHGIGTFNASIQFFNGYLAEVNFIDGLQLTPSSFGETDAITGRWKAKAFAGTYGTNGFYLPFTNQGTTQNLLTFSEDFSNAAWTKFQSTVTVNAAVAPDGTTTADKLIETASVGDHQLSRAYTAVNNTTYTLSAYAKAGERTVFRLYLQNKAGTYNYSDFDLVTGTIPILSGVVPAITAVGNGWYRCSVTANVGTGATSSPLAFLSYGTATAGSGTNGLFVWGAQLEASSSAGPYMYTGATAQASTLAIGADASVSTGGYNNQVANNFSVTAGTGNDSLVDSPTNYGSDTGVGGEVRGNYCTLSAIDFAAGSSGFTLTDGNLRYSKSVDSGNSRIRGNIFIGSGKYYWEYNIASVGAAGLLIGIASLDYKIGTTNDTFHRSYLNTGNKISGATSTSYGSSYTANDVIGLAVDVGAGTIVFYKNGTSQGTAFTDIAGSQWTSFIQGEGVLNLNFGQRPFAYTAPTGFKALCTTNLPTPTVQKSSTAMDVVTYTGNGATSQDITGLSFSPDLVWLKSRTDAYDHRLKDTIRGNFALFSNLTNAESGYSLDFLSNGIRPTLGANDNINSKQYVAWAWKESPIYGMDIVSYTGNGTGLGVAHGLGVAPAMYITKSRSATTGWYVYHKSLSGNAIYLNSTSASVANSGQIASFPSSSFLSPGNNADVNTNGATYIAYLFAEIEGYSKFGSYTGNGSADGTFVYCGFRPRWVMIKVSNATNSWIIIDSSRDAYNLQGNFLLPNTSGAEGSVTPAIDLVSNGFKMRLSNAGWNGSGETIIFAAFAESPFKYSRAR